MSMSALAPLVNLLLVPVFVLVIGAALIAAEDAIVLPWSRSEEPGYEQVSGDSGSGAILGDFKGESYGIGPSLLWVPETKSGNLSITASWLHDLDATRRLESDYVVVTLNWVLGK